MKSKNALKLACLSVGLAVTSLALDGQSARANSILDVNIDLTTAPVGFTYNNVWLAVQDNGAPVFIPVGSGFTNGISYVVPVASVPDSDVFSNYIVIGTTPGADVALSVSSPFSYSPLTWNNLFSIYGPPLTNESFVAAGLAANNPPLYLTPLFFPTDSTLLQANPTQSTGLFEFSVVAPIGNVSLALVPLPSQCLIGGALFALMALGKRSVKWLQLRQEQCLA